MNIYRHGDLIFTPIESLPERLTEKKVSKKTFVLAFGEVTGHKHVMTAENESDMKIYQDAQGRFVLQLFAPTKLSHEEHHTLVFEPGIYMMQNEREHDYFEHESRQVVD